MPITKVGAQGVTRAFVRNYPGALELACAFRKDAADPYGPRAMDNHHRRKGNRT